MKKYIKNKEKIVYTDNPELGELVIMKDTLPSPEEFKRARLMKEPVSVTLTLPKDVVEKVKKEAGKKRVSYKILLQSLISSYTRQRFEQSS